MVSGRIRTTCTICLSLWAKMLEDGIYVGKETFDQVMKCTALFIDDGFIFVKSANIYMEKDIPEGYMIFINGGKITQIRTFSIEE